MIGEPKIVEPVEKQEEVKDPETLEKGFSDEIEMLKLGNSLGLNDLSQIKQNQDKIDTLGKWALTKGAKTLDDAITMLRELGARMGGPREGQTYLNRLTEYTHLELERGRIDRQLRSLEV